ncbi:MAG: cell envelope integrity protein TolA [Gammaproteobacteria bacterium]
MYSKRTITLSILLHVALVVLLMVSVDFAPREVRAGGNRKKIVQAVVVDNHAVKEEVKRLKAAEEKARLERAQKVKEAERKVAQAEKKRKAEEKRLKELKAERARLKKKDDQARKRAAEADKKREADLKRLAKEKEQREDAERKKRETELAAAERKRIERALQDDLAVEEAMRQAAVEKSEIDRYVAAIQNRVRQSFTILPGLDGLSCTLRITLIPGGEVSQVQVMKSSGNATFDRQAENAVRKSAPLPVPADPRLFKKMRSISFVFDPQT